MVSSHAHDAEHWWYHDYAQISQFHGSRILYGFRRGYVTNVLSPISNVRLFWVLLFEKYRTTLLGQRSACTDFLP